MQVKTKYKQLFDDCIVNELSIMSTPMRLRIYMQKKLPPYGKYLDSLQKTGTPPKKSVFLFCGELAWKKAEGFQCNNQRPTTLCLPPYNDPIQYQWPVAECDVIVFDTSWCSLDYLEDIAFELLLSGASVVRICSTDHKLTVYKKDFDDEQKKR